MTTDTQTPGEVKLEDGEVYLSETGVIMSITDIPDDLHLDRERLAELETEKKEIEEGIRSLKASINDMMAALQANAEQNIPIEGSKYRVAWKNGKKQTRRQKPGELDREGPLAAFLLEQGIVEEKTTLATKVNAKELDARFGKLIGALAGKLECSRTEAKELLTSYWVEKDAAPFTVVPEFEEVGQ